MDSTEEKALPFISYKEQVGFVLNPEAEAFLLKQNRKLGVISVVGKYRTGKSFLINRVLLQRQKKGFNVGPTINPCTKGLWLWNHPIASQNPECEDMDVIVVDVEGFGGLDESANHDTRIFLFALLLSSMFIYNSVGSIDENAIQNLSLIINLAKEIQIKTNQQNENEDLGQYFPSFFWIVRDFALKLVDQSGNPISSKEYLENSLQTQKGVSDAIETKNRTRRLLKQFFKERDCATMVRPLESEKELQRLDEVTNDGLRPEFIDQMAKVRAKVMRKLRPKVLNGKYVTGPMLVELAKAYISAMNSGRVPNIENAWTYVVSSESHKNLEESLRLMDERLVELQKSGIKAEDVKTIKEKLKAEVFDHFKKRALGSDQELKDVYEQLKKGFKTKYRIFKERFSTDLRERYENFLKERYEPIEQKLKSDEYTNYYEFQHEFSKLRAEYETQMPGGPQKERVLKEFSERVYSLAAEQLTKKKESEMMKESRRLAKKLDLTETELQSKKKELDSEKEKFQQKLEEIEKEKNRLKGVESSFNERLATVTKERDTLRAALEEVTQRSKSEKEELETQSKRRIEELERALENTKLDLVKQQGEHEKERALTEQEKLFATKERDMLSGRIDSMKEEIERFKQEIQKKNGKVEALQKKVQELEEAKAKLGTGENEVGSDKVSTMTASMPRMRTTQESERDRAHLETQIRFLETQLEESKKIHNGLLAALHQGLNQNDSESRSDLVQTNRYLSVSLHKMEVRCQQLEEKVETLKGFKKMVKAATSLQCSFCSSSIPSNWFQNHIRTCNGSVGPIGNPMKQSMFMTHRETEVAELQILLERFEDRTGEFTLVCSWGQTTWRVTRNFWSLKEMNHAIFSQNQQNAPPSAVIFNDEVKMSPDERKRLLKQYLSDISRVESIRLSRPFRSFFDIASHVSEEEYSSAPQLFDHGSMFYNTDQLMRRNFDETIAFGGRRLENDLVNRGGQRMTQGPSSRKTTESMTSYNYSISEPKRPEELNQSEFEHRFDTMVESVKMGFVPTPSNAHHSLSISRRNFNNLRNAVISKSPCSPERFTSKILDKLSTESKEHSSKSSLIREFQE
eukprot:TRINITY_DN9884_c0_g1_i3.p1 TRINITY_DN9884_c0_g1~~TRINITY_DN9884_c0_g1_i3.p1  ORF type:complete len:1087 (+),score=311.01 TRINITY_DN9884_c0_g1_i3:56-3316(+)